MNRRDTNVDKLWRLLGAVEERILRAPDEEILEGLKEEGREVERFANEIKGKRSMKHVLA